MSSDKVPREQLVVEEILKELNVEDYEPGVVGYIMDYVYNYIHTVLEDAKVYSSHANKRTIDIGDLKLAVNLTLDKTHSTTPKKEFLLKLAKEKNSQPLPPIPEGRNGIRLPPDRHCLTSSNITIKSNQKYQTPSEPSFYDSRYTSYGIKTEPTHNAAPPPNPASINPYSSFSEQLQKSEPMDFMTSHVQPQHTYGKRKREQVEFDDYDI